ncbi:hypothetical protein [Metapseudomonas boanensis]|uniref:LysR substrate-binding domain-containing protein n=1 Tax=Metapseudomonas boanensis TaxID=2822138 RepID=A0ABS5XCK4_9GAMM|nr:hypothetical protein [Pseudomonas boanensis]MBT8765433.1 hypothetical protein [Pseudomonas boanensis]
MRPFFTGNTFSSPEPVTSIMRDGYRVFSLAYVAIQAAIDGQGIVLGQCSMIAHDLAAGRLIMPFPRALPLPTSYFLIGSKSAFGKEHCRDFHRWLVTRGREQTAINARLLGLPK